MNETPRPDAAEIERLRAEQARLEAEMEELRSRLQTDKARKGAVPGGSPRPRWWS